MNGSKGPRFVVRRSGIHGRGVFARRAIRAGETIVEYKGERVTEAEIGRRYPEDMHGINHTFVFGIEYDLNIDGGSKGNTARISSNSGFSYAARSGLQAETAGAT